MTSSPTATWRSVSMRTGPVSWKNPARVSRTPAGPRTGGNGMFW